MRVHEMVASASSSILVDVIDSAPPPDPPMSIPFTTSVTIIEDAQIAIGTNMNESGTQSEDPRVKDA